MNWYQTLVEIHQFAELYLYWILQIGGIIVSRILHMSFYQQFFCIIVNNKL